MIFQAKYLKVSMLECYKINLKPDRNTMSE